MLVDLMKHRGHDDYALLKLSRPVKREEEYPILCALQQKVSTVVLAGFYEEKNMTYFYKGEGRLIIK